MPNKQLETLLKLGFSDDQTAYLVSGGMWFEESGGCALSTYWNDPEKFSMHDEFYLIANLLFSLAGFSNKNIKNDDLLSYQVVYLYFLKPNAQSILSITNLIENKCYGDAFAVCRSLHARVNLMLLLSLEPKLFDDWLRNPKEDCYLEGHIRTELNKFGICTMDHIYKLASEVIHNQYQSNADIGYFEKGLFSDIPAIENQILVSAKYILAAAAYSMLQYGLLSKADNGAYKDYEIMNSFFNKLLKSYLVQSRFEHLFTLIGEDRHWEKVGKNKVSMGGLFNFSTYSDNLSKFRSKKGKGQIKKLGKEYIARLKNG